MYTKTDKIKFVTVVSETTITVLLAELVWWWVFLGTAITVFGLGWLRVGKQKDVRASILFGVNSYFDIEVTEGDWIII